YFSDNILRCPGNNEPLDVVEGREDSGDGLDPGCIFIRFIDQTLNVDMLQRRRFSFGHAGQRHDSHRGHMAPSVLTKFPKVSHAFAERSVSHPRWQPTFAQLHHTPAGSRCRASTEDRDRTNGSWF